MRGILGWVSRTWSKPGCLGKLLIGFLALLLLACPCGLLSQLTGKSTPTPTPTEVGASAKPIATEKQTAIPKPTNTPKPTNIPAATATPLPPTAVPKPVKLSGSGDSILDFENPFEGGIVHISGNADAGYFGVTSFGSDGTQIDLLVNTTEPYDGFRPLDFRGGQHTVRFQVKASGKWAVEVLPLTAARKLSVPGTIEGKGDDVVALGGGKPDLAKIRGNAIGRYFGVTGYGKYTDLLVNTTDPYEGTVILKADTVVIEVRAEGPWSIAVTSK